MRTALDIIQSLNVDSELPEHQVNPPQSHGGVLPDVIHLEGIQPVQTTAFYADSHVIAESTTAVVVGSEEEVPNALAFHLSHVFPIASPISAAPEQTESEQENEEL